MAARSYRREGQKGVKSFLYQVNGGTSINPVEKITKKPQASPHGRGFFL
jgi:hypothetical protein